MGNLEIVKYTKEGFVRWSDYKGVSNRPQFWWYVLGVFLISIVFGMISEKLSALWSLIVLVPGIMISIRRMHDIGKSGWWYLINIIPVIGWIVFIVLAAQPTKK